MSEAEIISELGFRTEAQWNLLQWWVSVSFAVMMAAYIGSEKLTKQIIALIVVMYLFTTLRILLVLGNHSAYILDMYTALQTLSESGGLSAVGAGALERRAGESPSILIGNIWFLFSFIFTIGFVLYCYKYVKKPE